jgi:hypothetical protein
MIFCTWRRNAENLLIIGACYQLIGKPSFIAEKHSCLTWNGVCGDNTAQVRVDRLV